jgi:hypothetical protein
MPRKRSNQTKHNRKVRDLAKELEKAGWDVQADISGFDQPDPIGQDDRIPDVVAKKAGAKKIIEVETLGTMESHSDQHSTFRRSAGQGKRTTFEVEEA